MRCSHLTFAFDGKDQRKTQTLSMNKALVAIQPGGTIIWDINDKTVTFEVLQILAAQMRLQVSVLAHIETYIQVNYNKFSAVTFLVRVLPILVDHLLHQEQHPTLRRRYYGTE